MVSRPLAGRGLVVALALAVCVAATSRTANAPIVIPAPAAVPVAPSVPAVPNPPSVTPTALPESDRGAADPGFAPGPVDSGLGDWTAALLPDSARDVRALIDAPRYSITLAISPDRRVVTGTQETRYVNREAEPLHALVLRLFPGTPNMGSVMRLSRVAVNGNLAPTLPITLRSVADLAPIVDTAAVSVPLAVALIPGAALTLTVAYTIQVTDNPTSGYRAFGRVNGVLAIPGAYAAIPARRNGIWLMSAAPNYGDIVLAEAAWFRVEIESDEDLALVAPGLCSAAPGAAAGRQRVICVAGPIREFAVTAGRFNKVDASIRLTGGDVVIESYATFGRMRGAALAARMASDALVSYERRFGAYPYRILKVFESPTTVGGMEYSMLAGVTDNLYDAPEAPYFEWIVVHEVAHQWWYGLVGSDPVNEAWLDEGLTNFSITFYFEDVHGPAYALANRNSDYYGRYANALKTYPDQPAGLPTGQYPPGAYGPFIYGKAPIFFDVVRRAAGDEAFLRWIRLYAARNRFGIAQAANLLSAADETGLGPVARAAWQAWVAAR
ncbi:MAG: M1 family aminopeptidase [Thermoflexales bacterium]